MNAVIKPNYFLRKLSPQTVTDEIGLDLLKLREIDGGKVKARVLYDLFGVVNRLKQGSTDKGPWVKFLGRFKAITPADANGEVRIFESGAAHIPVMEDMLFATLEEARAANQGKPVVIEIAFRVSIKTAPDGKPSATGYEFDVQPLIQRAPSAEDPLERLMAEAKSLALPAPTPVAASTPVPATEAPPKSKK